MTREEGKEFANALKNNYTIDFDKLPEFCDLVISALENKGVNPQELKTGHWSHDGSHWKNRFICSECGYKLFDEPTNFCPNCGAKMKGGE